MAGISRRGAGCCCGPQAAVRGAGRLRTIRSLPLTARETQIARLAGDGVSNPKIAPPLFTGSAFQHAIGRSRAGAGVPTRDPTDASAFVRDGWCWYDSHRRPRPRGRRVP
jgi:hypothetical protein